MTTFIFAEKFDAWLPISKVSLSLSLWIFIAILLLNLSIFVLFISSINGFGGDKNSKNCVFLESAVPKQ